jgi:hypothetical protein
MSVSTTVVSDPQLAAVLQSELHGGFHDNVVDGLERRRRQPVEAAVEGVVLRTRCETIESE